MYTIQYIFGDSLTDGFTHPEGLIKLTLTLTVNKTGTNQQYLASDYGLFINKFGTLKTDPDLEENTLAPCEHKFKIFDKNKTLRNLVHDSADAIYIDKNYAVKLEIKYTGDASYTQEFEGNVHPKSTNYKEKYFSFTAFNGTEKINSTALSDKDGEQSNPLNLTYTENPRAVGLKIVYPRVWEEITIKSLVEKTFELVDGSITTEFYNDWLYAGYYNSAWVYNITFAEIVAESVWVGSIFDSDKFPITNAGELLRQIAFEFGAIAGIKGDGTAFMKQVFYYNAGQVQTMGPRLSHNKGHFYNDVDWTNINNAYWDQDLDDDSGHRYVIMIKNISGSDRVVKSWGWAPVEIVDNGYVDKREGDNGLEKTIISFADIYDFEGATPLRASNIKKIISGNDYKIYGIRQPDITLDNPDALVDGSGNKFNSFNMFLAYYWLLLKGKSGILDYDEFTFGGVKYDYCKPFDDEGSGYSIISMTKDYDDNFTSIKALEVVQKEFTSSTSTPEQVFPGGSVSVTIKASVVMDFNLTYSNIGSTAVYAGSINADEILEGFIVQVDEAFIADEVASFKIYASGNDLLTLDDIIITSTGTIFIPKVVRFTGNTKIYYDFVQGAQSPTQGSMYIAVKKLKTEE